MIQSNLKEILEAKQMSIREFANRIDYRFESVRQLYNGTTERIPVTLLDRACRELKCDVCDLLSFEDER